jgi:hypothetical protein
MKTVKKYSKYIPERNSVEWGYLSEKHDFEVEQGSLTFTPEGIRVIVDDDYYNGIISLENFLKFADMLVKTLPRELLDLISSSTIAIEVFAWASQGTCLLCSYIHKPGETTNNIVFIILPDSWTITFPICNGCHEFGHQYSNQHGKRSPQGF